MTRILALSWIYILFTFPQEAYGQKNGNIVDITDLISDSLSIRSSDGLSEIYSMKVFEHMGKEFLYTFNDNMTGFDVYDLRVREHAYSITLPEIPELPQFKAVGFDITGVHEIYLINSNGNLIMIDSLGSLKDTWQVAKDLPKDSFVVNVSNQLNNFTVYQRKVYLPLTHQYKKHHQFTLKNKPAMLVYDLDNRELEKGFGGYPKSTHKKGALTNQKYEFTTLKMKDQNQIIFSYAKDPEFTIYNTNKNKRVKRSKAKSVFLDDDKVRAQKDQFGNVIQYIHANGFYHNIYWDPTHELFYRTVAHHQETEPVVGSARGLARRPFSIQVIDKNFNLLSEIRVPERAPLEHMKMSVTKEGLLLQICNGSDRNQVDFVLLDMAMLNH
ncbi:MAG TPA: DUF4221 family protein [Anditalea sp.]|nr:DUF4221 family protein [Anditalea sp.]